MDINHISISRKGVWEQCQQQYKFQYHLKAKVDEAEPFYFTYGKLVHKIAEEFINNRGDLLLEEISRNVLGGKIPIDMQYEDPKEEGGERIETPIYAPKLPLPYKKRLPGHLKAIRRLTNKLGTGGQTEFKFRFDLDPPNERMVTGLIDRLIEHDGKYIIIDYKTTKKGPYRKTRTNIVHDMQLRCYARVIQKEFGANASDITAALYYLEGGDLIAAQFSQESLIAAEAELLKAHKDIENTPADKAWGNVGDHCRRCKFVKMCPFYALT